MKRYKVDISPDAKREFLAYLDGAQEFGDDTVENLLDAFDACIENPEVALNAGFEKLPCIPAKYSILHLWKHYWIVFQAYEEVHTVKIECVIDDRQNYGKFVH